MQVEQGQSLWCLFGQDHHSLQYPSELIQQHHAIHRFGPRFQFGHFRDKTKGLFHGKVNSNCRARFTSRVEPSSSRVDLTGRTLRKPNKINGVHGFTGKNEYEGIQHGLARTDTK